MEQTDAPIPPAPAEAPLVESPIGDQTLENQAQITSHPISEDGSAQTEERVEYRDQDGNLLNEEEVAALKGKVSFETRYETRTRVVDAAGNVLEDGIAGADGHAPPHPDVDREPETAAANAEDDGREYPASAAPEDDISKEKSVEEIDLKIPKPGSEGIEATK